MSTEEFSIQFDVLYNNVTSNQAPGLNEFEKSVFLTKAQSQLVIEYFNRRTDAIGGGFDGSEHRQYDFSSIVRTENLFNVNTYKERISNLEKLNKDSIVYLFPYNYFLAVNEVITDNKYQHSVMPIDYSEYQRLMLKPYTFPVKRGAWRIITDKKNCNFVHEDASGNSLAYDEVASADYKILTTWADQKRNQEIIIKNGATLTGAEVAQAVNNDDTEFEYLDYNWTDSEGREFSITFFASNKWSSDKKTYRTCIGTKCAAGNANKFADDEIIMDAWKAVFKDIVEGNTDINYNKGNSNNELVKALTHLDAFKQSDAPGKFYTFSNRTFTTSVISIPMVEVIGRFSGTPVYQMKYVRTLTPIILADLSDFGSGISIDGIKKVTECVLPEECHHEILERAVTLAKIAWAGATATQVANQQRG